jgi:hypothetical protein
MALPVATRYRLPVADSAAPSVNDVLASILRVAAGLGEWQRGLMQVVLITSMLIGTCAIVAEARLVRR